MKESDSPPTANVECLWRGNVSDAELVALTHSHEGQPSLGWWDRVRPRSLGWVTARLTDNTLVGFVNVAWDGSDHAFLLDTKTRGDLQRQGIATKVVQLAAQHAKAAGCEWLHVDFDDLDRLGPFYFDACGFRKTHAGLIHLSESL
jgi:GNAT superfamily N-acetyltransferase